MTSGHVEGGLCIQVVKRTEPIRGQVTTGTVITARSQTWHVMTVIGNATIHSHYIHSLPIAYICIINETKIRVNCHLLLSGGPHSYSQRNERSMIRGAPSTHPTPTAVIHSQSEGTSRLRRACATPQS
jgi:hypothetical protein